MADACLRVLIVEDDDDAREMYLLALSFAGIDGRGVGDPDQAFPVAVEWQPDVVFTDYLLRTPRSGIDLCRLLHADPRTRHIPAVVMTAASRKHEVETVLGAGCTGIRMKPYPPDLMLEDIKKLTERAAAG
jgi:CheY-like chemotaxis protein